MCYFPKLDFHCIPISHSERWQKHRFVIIFHISMNSKYLKLTLSTVNTENQENLPI